MHSEVNMKVFDLHCDTIGECYKHPKNIRTNDMHLSLEKAAEYDEYCQVFAIWITDDKRGQTAVDYFNNVADLYFKLIFIIAKISQSFNFSILIMSQI